MTIEPTLLGRRHVLGAALGAGAVLLGGARIFGSQVDDATAASACSLTPEQEVGPFYVALEQIRSNIVGGMTGARLKLLITIIDSSTCKPLKGAAVDIWHANAIGTYSPRTPTCAPTAAATACIRGQGGSRSVLSIAGGSPLTGTITLAVNTAKSY